MGLRIVVGIFLSFAMMASAHAASRAEFDQLVQQVQAKPSDTTLRARVIKMAQELKPAPAIPEEARRSFVQGNTFAKSAKDAAGQKLAIDAYNDALKLAPWWGEAYYNLAFAQELAGRFTAAKGSLKLYLLTGPAEKDAREANDRIYALEAKEKLAKTDASAAVAANAGAAERKKQQAATNQASAEAQEKENLMRSLDGAVYGYRLVSNEFVVDDFTIQIRGDEVTSVRSHPYQPSEPIETYRCVLHNFGCELFRGDSGYILIEVQTNQVVEKTYWLNGTPIGGPITYTRRN